MSSRRQDESLSKVLEETISISINSGTVKVDVDAEVVFEWIDEECYPSDVFGDRKLEDWAEAHGYVKE